MPTPTNIWSHWNDDLLLLLPLLVAVALFVRGALRTESKGITANRWGAVAFAGGLLTLFVALISPLDALTQMLFSVHMVQYTLLTVLAPALIIFSHSTSLLLRGLPTRAFTAIMAWWNESSFAHRAWALLTRRPVVGLIDVGMLYFWHMPGIYESALQGGLHAVELISFIVAGLLSWRLVRQPSQSHKGLRGYGATLLFLVITSLLGVVLGMALFFSSNLWYPIYQSRAPIWGVTALLDQQIGGIVLGVVPEMFDAIPFLIVVAALLRAEERHAEERLDLGSPDSA